MRDKGWWLAHRFLILRRLSQLAILALFLLGPLAGVWIARGNLSSSLTLSVLPLTDPFVLSQVLATRHWPETSAVLGAAIVVVFYATVGGRVFCSWVCPVNRVTDSAAWLRRKLKIGTGRAPRGGLRFWLLGAVLLACAATGSTVWETINPVSLTQRALIFGGTLAWGAAATVFLLDLLIAPRGWCGHVCPEPQVIVLPLKGKAGCGPVITDAACTNCGRCIDVCAPNVFKYTHRFNIKRD